ncbi:SRPBCC family protein [Jannaschia sp. CCS1]|uniref:SRPBCC family protein n=1 Tax=Jannaschia sp. (strain CCS1) TaxID=290400 RepID=UPI00140FB5F9|nr:SRPBCC family protein [Jannaschia sp. CCS1]
MIEAIKHAGGVLPSWALDGFAPWIWYLSFFYVISYVLERDPFSWLGLRFRFHTTSVRTINATPDGVWAAVAPDADTIGTYWTGSIAQVDARPDLGPNTVNVRFFMGPPLSLVQTHTRRIWEQPFHFLYDFKPEDVKIDATAKMRGVHGSFEMRCEPLAEGPCRVTITHNYPDLGIGSWSLLWLDDMGGSEMDAIAARLEGRRDRSIAGWAARKMAGA